MTITAYQIQNIIQTYNKQLKIRWSDRDNTQYQNMEVLPDDVVDISSEGKKKQVLDHAGQEAVKQLKERALEPLKGE